MKLLIHDMAPDRVEALFPAWSTQAGWHAMADDGHTNHCIACYGCWIKTPGACVVRDQAGDMGATLATCDEVALVSKCCYGGPSPFVKCVLDRSIPYLHPDFALFSGMMHHKMRYDHSFTLHAVFYAPAITEQEAQIARQWVEAVSLNLGCTVGEVQFLEVAEQ